MSSLFQSIKKLIYKMSQSFKRPLSPSSCKQFNKEKKISKYDENEPSIEGKPKFRMYAVLMMYSGSGYFGMQRNTGFKTIESDLLNAFHNAGLINADMLEKPGLFRFQRASKTDKDVSAAGQVCSCKLPEEPNLVSLVNSHLPEQIRVIDIIRSIRSFHAQHWCHYRSYQYVCPTFAFSPRDTPDRTIEHYRISATTLTRLQQVLELYHGTKNYHNFTSGRKPSDPSCQRYMRELCVSSPYLHGDYEYVVITIKGQSFMLHQIRKMIGLTIAIMRGHTDEGSFNKVFTLEKFDVPKAPGLGLLLDKVHYDVYNRKFPNHTSIEWEKYADHIEDFKHKQIFEFIIKTEVEEKSMLRWLDTLCLHTYERSRSTDGSYAVGQSSPDQLKAVPLSVDELPGQNDDLPEQEHDLHDCEKEAAKSF